MQTHYETLGLARGASIEDVKAAFRKIALQHHPDRPGGNAEKFKKASEAYAVVGNPEKKEQYDRQMGFRAGSSVGTKSSGGIRYDGFYDGVTVHYWSRNMQQAPNPNAQQSTTQFQEAQRSVRDEFLRKMAQAQRPVSRDDVAKAFKDKMGKGFFTTS